MTRKRNDAACCTHQGNVRRGYFQFLTVVSRTDIQVGCNRFCDVKLRVLCRSLGCLDPQCVLCEHNPHRRCNVNFAPKYLVNDILKAKCEAPIRVEVIDRSTGVPLGEDISDIHLEVGCLS